MYQLSVNPQGTMEKLNYPQFKIKGTAYWIVLEKAVIMVCGGWVLYWLEGQPNFEKNHLDALAMQACDRSEVKNALLNEVAILQQLTKLL
jgi:hypothetical protein